MRKVHMVVLAAGLLLAAGCSKGSSSEPGTLARFYAALRTRWTDGKTELRRALEAKKAAQSWRMKVDLTMHPGAGLETEVFVSCPDRERIVTRLGQTTYQTVRVGADAYLLGSDGQWTRSDLPKDAYPCGGNAGLPSPWAMMSEGRDMTTVIASMAGMPNSPMSVTPGDLVQTGEGPCQQWVVSFEHPRSKAGGPGMKYTVCLDTSDRLPRQLIMGSGGMVTTYSGWNKPVQIDTPAQAMPATSTAKAH